jgi:hypothetical protein
MIFYSLKGPNYKLEIHDHKLKLVRRVWWALFASKNEITEWKLEEINHFQITVPKFIWGKLEWATNDGKKGSFRFTTNSVIMQKIEKYMNKLIQKNLQHQHSNLIFIESKKKHKTSPRKEIAA